MTQKAAPGCADDDPESLRDEPNPGCIRMLH